MTKNSAQQKLANEGLEKAAVARAIVGTVVSDKMNKTIVVQVMRMVKHPVYGKYMKHYSKMYVHDAENQCKEGDVVRIKQVRPLSKLKSWNLVEIVRRAEHAFDAQELESQR